MYRVYLGVHDKAGAMAGTDPWQSESSRVRAIHVHPLFDATNKLNDVALLELDADVEASERVQPACLPESTKSAPVDAWFIVGWGSLFEGGPMSDWLRNAPVDVYDGSYCRNVVKEFRKNWSIQICAGWKSF